MEKLTELPIFQYRRSGEIKQFSLYISTRSRVCPERVFIYSNQSWPPVISPLGVYLCFRNTMQAKQGCYRDWQGHTPFVSIDGALMAVKRLYTRLCIARDTSTGSPENLQLASTWLNNFLRNHH
jgi:hypothetical protein